MSVSPSLIAACCLATGSLAASEKIILVAGGGAAVATTFNGIHNFVVLANGDLLLADSFNQAISGVSGTFR